MNYYYKRLEIYPYKKSSMENLVRSAQDFFSIHLDNVYVEKLYWIQSTSPLQLNQLINWGTKVFSDPIVEGVRYEDDSEIPSHDFVVEIHFRPGVTDNVGKTATEALRMISPISSQGDLKVFSGYITYLQGKLSIEEAHKVGEELLGNPLLHKIKIFSAKSYKSRRRFQDIQFPQLSLKENPQIHTISLNRSDKELLHLSQQNCWAFSLEEIHHIQNFFKSKEVQQLRTQKGLGHYPTDVEIEVLAQTWSEHCKHKIFQATIDYKGESIKSLFKTYIKGATHHIIQKRGIDWTQSLFHDNAGIVRFDPHIDHAIKVETHNSPSALDPYGGALTGVLGVNRDILGVGLGARPIANTNVFCVGDFQTASMRPVGTKHPRYILQGVHKGVEDAGNKSGIPTINGAIHFHADFSGKPLVFCGTVGVLPHTINNHSSSEKYFKPGDRIFVGGGAIGKDGIHGATFSSLELTKEIPASVVQIGDPLTQKRLSDFLLEARDAKTYTGITDNGAGGLSSSIGEMALHTGGAVFDLAKNPVKYPGLSPFELMISEAQERMTFAVPWQQVEKFKELAQKHGVEVYDLGEFTSSGYLEVFYKQERVCYLPLDFLHNSLPTMRLKASLTPPRDSSKWYSEEPKKMMKGKGDEIKEVLLNLLSRPNIQSKEKLVRQYDHEVQAATHIKPFVGPTQHGPSDAGVIWSKPHGGDPRQAVAIGCGLSYKISRYDCYQMAQYAVDEAIRNVVAVGANPLQIALVDNFCWPDPVASIENHDGEYKLAQLVEACKGLYDLSTLYGTPLVSGKDSMKNDYIGKDPKGNFVKVSIPPTLLITAMGSVPNVYRTATSDFKSKEDLIYLIGRPSIGFLGSEFDELYTLIDEKESKLPSVKGKENWSIYLQLHKAITEGLCHSVHDISDGGALTAIVESMIGGHLGAKLNLTHIKTNIPLFDFCFNESPGRFIVSIPKVLRPYFEALFHKDEYKMIGEVIEKPKLYWKTLNGDDEVELDQLEKVWGGFHV